MYTASTSASKGCCGGLLWPDVSVRCGGWVQCGGVEVEPGWRWVEAGERQLGGGGGSMRHAHLARCLWLVELAGWWCWPCAPAIPSRTLNTPPPLVRAGHCRSRLAAVVTGSAPGAISPSTGEAEAG